MSGLRRLCLALAPAALMLLLGGCASVVNGHNQSVSVQVRHKAEPVQGANCSLTNDKGVWFVATPGSVSVHRSYRDLEVKCTAAGLPDGIVSVKSSTTAAAFGNILVGGVIGASVDVATGAAYSYPNLIPVELGQTGRIESDSATTAGGRSNVKVPYLNDAQQASYTAYLGRPLPRAFAIAPNQHFAYTWGHTPFDKSLPSDPSERALLQCSRFAGVGCELFAVDNNVVFKSLPPQPQPPGVRSRAGSYPVDATLAAAKVPFLNDGQQAEYQVFLTRSPPRAFAISENGHFAMAWGTDPQDKSQPRDPSERALAGCKRASGHDCKLYVVDQNLVWGAR